MKKLLFILIIGFTFLPSLSCFAQSTSQPLSKKELKEKLRKDQNEQLKLIYQLMESKKWILQIELAQSLSLETTTFEPNSNFIICENDLATIQFPATEFIQTGETKFTGLTTEANITIYELQEFKDHKLIQCLIQYQTNDFPWVNMRFEINYEGFATISFTQLNGVNFTLSGTIESQDDRED